jgi:hypothetical protein
MEILLLSFKLAFIFILLFCIYKFYLLRVYMHMCVECSTSITSRLIQRSLLKLKHVDIILNNQNRYIEVLKSQYKDWNEQ